MGSEAGVLCAPAVFRLAVAGQGDHDGRGRRRRLQPAGDLVAVEARQADIHQHDLGRLGAREVEPLGAVGGREDLVPVQLEERAERLAGVGVVFDEEDPGHASTVSRAPSDRPRLDSANERMVLTRAHRPRRRLSMTSKAPTALAVALALAVGGIMPAAAQGPIRIGASLSLTGTYAKLGKNQHEGYQLCIKELNAKGGLLGRKLDLVMYDDQSLPPTAVRLYEKLITEDKVDAVMGPDFSALLTKLRAANPDVVAAATYFDDAVALTRQMKELNVNPKMYGVTVGGDLPEFYDTLKQNAEYIYGATQWEHTLPYPGNQEFFDTYKKEFAHEPSYHSAAGYAGCLIYAEGVRRAGSLDADKVREALLKLELKTAFGEYKVDQDGFQIAHKMVLFQWHEGKKFTVWPDELAAVKPHFPTPPWNQR